MSCGCPIIKCPRDVPVYSLIHTGYYRRKSGALLILGELKGSVGLMYARVGEEDPAGLSRSDAKLIRDSEGEDCKGRGEDEKEAGGGREIARRPRECISFQD
eukprot:1367724-Amorphochlora_amoeboformis.AAC.1